MPQMTLYSPEITCEHCIATIESAVSAVPGARFLHGDHDGKQFTVEVESGAVLDTVTAALQEQGYPLGEAAAAGGAAQPAAAADWLPEYRVTRTGAGADVNYACPCSCEAGFAFDRSQSDQQSESCCCGRQLLVGVDVEARLRSLLDAPDAYRLDIQEIAMPWGQPMQAALATPREEGAHDDG